MSERLITESSSADLRYELLEGPVPDFLRPLVWQLHSSVFPPQSPETFWLEADQQRRLLTILTWAGETLAAYKMGYERKPGHFYSWLGCVSADFRRRGIASDLMRRQHDWCLQNGFHTVRTQTRNQWRDMLILNLRHGFDITGTFLNEAGSINIILEKKLNGPD
ncbi:GNAT family N-acetyltransferase [Tellurirhabdus rosea]|uniref:GNAT family N-acetyltransferase n=1 Tax=Tellurirhabdus rosea TaxID=2674997 RepID=UPI002256BC87|nr:GNAT family N-acetyltransferase [Tellurirhabdus rosea]